MYTSLGVAAVSVILMVPEAAPTRSWHSDYSEALELGQQQRKPLAVVVGRGENGLRRLCTDGEISSAARELLQSRFVAVYVDLTTAEGRELAAELEISSSSGIVISDRNGQVMAFHHDGRLSNAALLRALKRFSNQQGSVSHTASLEELEQSTRQRTSFYPASPDAYAARRPSGFSQAPAYSQQSILPGYWSGFGGGC